MGKLQSYSVVCTDSHKTELLALVHSIRLYSTLPIFIYCDEATSSFIAKKYPALDCVPILTSEKLSEYAKYVSKIKKHNKFHRPEIIYAKMDCITDAVKKYGNTLFVDADVKFVRDPECSINFESDAMISPHFYATGRVAQARQFGAFNAGYVYTAHKNFGESWKKLYLSASTFYEQQCMHRLFEEYNILLFDFNHNVGLWRYTQELKNNRAYIHTHNDFKNVISLHYHHFTDSYTTADAKLKLIYDALKVDLDTHLPDGVKNFAKKYGETHVESQDFSLTEPTDDWGNCFAVFKTSYEDGKFNLGSQPALKTHRGGWKRVLKTMEPLHNVNGVYCETFVESVFQWFRYDNEQKGNIPINRPWVGFIHNPHNIPDWYLNDDEFKIELDTKFADSLKACHGMFAMSEYHANGLRKLYPDTVFDSVLHPYSTEEVQQWNQDARQLVSVGYWLRKQSSIYLTQVPSDWTKIKLWPYKEGSAPNEFVRNKLQKELDQFDYDLPDIEHRYNLSNKDYDNFLSNSVVLLDLHDTSANNTILECVQRAVPIIVRRHPAVIEYLGEEYPLYFDKLSEVKLLLEKRHIAHAYLKELQKSEKLSMATFYNAVVNSKIYTNL